MGTRAVVARVWIPLLGLGACVSAPVVTPPLPPPRLAGGVAHTIDVKPSAPLAEALALAHPGDVIRLRTGSYGPEEITAAFASPVVIEAAPGEKVTFAGLSFLASSNLTLRGFRIQGGLRLQGCHDFHLTEMVLDAGDGDGSALFLQGQKKQGSNHHIKVEKSQIRGGGRTVFVLGSFAPSEQWNHDLTFTDDDFNCGRRCCFQLSGARDMVIGNNRVHTARGDGVLMAGATRIEISNNELDGGGDARGPAVKVATPGKEWDNFEGVKHMISSQVLVSKNRIRGWNGGAVELDACRNVDIGDNVVEGTLGLVSVRREPHGFDGTLIFTGNEGIRLWNNVLPGIKMAEGDPAPEMLDKAPARP